MISFKENSRVMGYLVMVSLCLTILFHTSDLQALCRRHCKLAANREETLSAGFHGIVMKSVDGSWYITSERSMPVGVNHNLTQIKITPSPTGYNYTVTIIQAYAFGWPSYLLHTTEGVYT